MTLRRIFGGTGLLLLVLLLAGCGPKGIQTVKVTGKVTLDGQPVADAAIVFVPASGPMAMGKSDANGNYTLTTGDRTGNGAVPGMHKISVQKANISGINVDPSSQLEMAPGQMEPKHLLPERYSSPETSGLTAEVKTGMGPVPLELKSQP